MPDPYCWPGSTCLRNRFGIRDTTALEAVEQRISAVRYAALLDAPLPGGYDAEHFRAFHRALFSDVYDWAGELRTVDIGKDGTWFCPARYVGPELEKVFVRLGEWELLAGLDRTAFLARFGWVYGELNVVHAFREGNGRAQRAFLRQLAAAAGWRVAWERLDADENVAACRRYWASADAGALAGLLDPVTARLPGESPG